MEFGNRLKSVRIEHGFTQKALAESVGVSTTTIQNWENGTKAPSMGAIVSLSGVLRISADDLLGLRSMRRSNGTFILTRAEKSLLDDFRVLDSHGRRAVQTLCRIEKARVAEESRPTQNIVELPTKIERFIPHYTTPSAAGISVPLDGSDFEMMLVNDSVPAEADCAVNIQGNSMAPYIHDGDMVYVKKDVDLSIGDVGIFCVDGAMYCKQYYLDEAGNLILVSANPELRNTNVRVAVDSGQTVRVYGKVLLGYKLDLPDYLFE